MKEYLLRDGIIEEIDAKIDPTDYPSDEFSILEVSKYGVFLKDSLLGSEATQMYKQVRAGEIVYNPHRVNIGSIGVVPAYIEKGCVSSVYVVFRPTNPRSYPANYLTSVLKQPRYLKVIMNYSLESTRAHLPYNELIRIIIPFSRKTN